MKKRAIALLLALSLTLCFVSCDNPKPASTPTNTPMPTPTETPWALCSRNTGSSKTLRGNCLIINIFLSDEESSFTEKEKKKYFDSLFTALNYLTKEAEKYNQTISFTYDTEDTNLDYTVEYILPQSAYGTKKEWDYRQLIENLSAQYNIDSVIQKYNSDNVFFMIVINKEGRSYAISHNTQKDTAYFNEYATIYSYDGLSTNPEKGWVCSGNSTTISHEILHLFGAIDLYDLESETLALAKEYFPMDIMLIDSPMLHKLTISDLDAYLIGWKDTLDERYKIFLR